jgi:hypothetical protein
MFADESGFPFALSVTLPLMENCAVAAHMNSIGNAIKTKNLFILSLFLI